MIGFWQEEAPTSFARGPATILYVGVRAGISSTALVELTSCGVTPAATGSTEEAETIGKLGEPTAISSGRSTVRTRSTVSSPPFLGPTSWSVDGGRMRSTLTSPQQESTSISQRDS